MWVARERSHTISVYLGRRHLKRGEHPAAPIQHRRRPAGKARVARLRPAIWASNLCGTRFAGHPLVAAPGPQAGGPVRLAPSFDTDCGRHFTPEARHGGVQELVWVAEGFLTCDPSPSAIPPCGAVDFDTNIVIASTIHSGDAADGETIKEMVVDAQVYLQEATCKATRSRGTPLTRASTRRRRWSGSENANCRPSPLARTS